MNAEVRTGQPARTRLAVGQWALVGLWAVVAGLILLPPHDFWDGRITEAHTAGGRLDLLWIWLTESRWHLHYAALAGLHGLAEAVGLPTLHALRAAMGLALAGFAYECGRYGRTALGFSGAEARAVTGLVLVFPAWHVLVSTVHLMHIVCPWLALLGFRLWGQGARWAAVPLMLVSLQLNSIFALLPALFWAGAVGELAGGRWPRRAAAEAALATIALGGVFVALSALAPPEGQYGDYNRIALPDSGAAVGALAQTVLSFWPPMHITAALVLLVALAALAMRLARGARATAALRPLAEVGLWRDLGVGAMLFAAAALPYALVGKDNVWLPQDWSDRHTFLVALPAALITVRVARAVAGLGARPWLALAVVAIIGAGFAARLWDGVQYKYLALVEDLRTARTLATIAPPPPGTVIIDEPARRMHVIRHYELAWIAEKAWGRRDWAGVILFPRQPDTVARYETAVAQVLARPHWPRITLMPGFDPACRTDIAIEGAALTRWAGVRWMVLRDDPPVGRVTAVDTRCAE